MPTPSSPSSGRSVRDAEATQQQILEAAEFEFSRHGLKGARISAIARRAGVTTAMIHYYFESKEGLYKAVLQRPLDEVQGIFSQFDPEAMSPPEALAQFVRMAIAYESQHLQRQLLWFQEACQNEGEYFKQGNWPQIFSYVVRIIERGMADGSFRPADLTLTLVHILSVCIFYFTVHENWKHLAPEVDRLSTEAINQHTEAAIAFILGGLRPLDESKQ